MMRNGSLLEIMHEKILPGNPGSLSLGSFRFNLTKDTAFLLIGSLIAALGGWLSLNSAVLNEHELLQSTSPVQFAMAGIALLVIAWRMAGHTRFAAWALLFAWHLGAGSAVPSGWAAFFENDWGYVGWVIWAALAATPALLLPSRFAPYALAAGATITALTPIGMMNPLSAAIAFWPGGEWLGLAFAVGILLLPSINHEKKFVIAALVVMLWGAVQNAWYDAEKPSVPVDAHAVETFEGRHPSLAIEWFGRQARIANRVKDDLEAGARLVVTPEGAVDKWDAWAAAVWRHAKATSSETGNMALVGVYRETKNGWQNGLMDLASGEFHSGSVPMPISMWKPWSDNEHYPFELSALPRTIKTPVGEAAYLMCFEELLVWPLAIKAGFGNPTLLIASSNQWFTTGATAEAQRRTNNLQARLWGLPVLRAVNWPDSNH